MLVPLNNFEPLLAHRLRIFVVMKKQNFMAAVFLQFVCLIAPPALLPQSKAAFTRTTLSRMDVLSRAALFESAIAEAARKQNVDPLILWTIAYNETRFRPWLTSPKNAQGLMQFMPATASRFGLANPYEPNASIHAASRYVKYLGGLFNWRLDSVLAAYNAGEGTVLAYLHGRKLHSGGKVINAFGRRTPGGIPPYRETVNYVSQGVKVYRWLETQSRFENHSFRSLNAAMSPPKFPELSASDKKPTGNTAALKILYEPRTGKRFRIESGEEKPLRAIVEDGPVIISPDLRSLPAGKARSTFAGIRNP